MHLRHAGACDSVLTGVTECVYFTATHWSLHPPWLLQESELAGYPIPKGMSVCANIYAMHRCGTHGHPGGQAWTCMVKMLT
jgi:cytochrome P450